MTRHIALSGARLGRRRLLHAAGGSAALAALGLPRFTFDAGAQDAITLTMWNNHPEWRDRLLEILAAFEETNPASPSSSPPFLGRTTAPSCSPPLPAGRPPTRSAWKRG